MGHFLSIAGALALVLGVVVLVGRFLARLRTVGGGGEASLRVRERAALGPDQGIALVDVEDTTVALGYGDGGVRLILVLDQKGGEDGAAGGRSVGSGAGDRSSDRVAPPGTLPPSAPDRQEGLTLLRRTARAMGRGILSGGLGLMLLGLSAVPLGAIPQSDPDPEPPEAVVRGAQSARESPAPAGLADFSLELGGGEEPLELSGPVGAVLFIGFLTLIPTLLLLTTSFTRILVVLHLLKQAIGAQTAPPAHLLAALALLLTGFVMGPTFQEANRAALGPWMDGEIDEAELFRRAKTPFRAFMLDATRESHVARFVEMSPGDAPEAPDEISTVVLASAFVTSELKTAFQMGFVLFLPFVIIDLVVASVLMSMGMFMLPPVMVSLPFKLLLFVLVDGWTLVVGGLVQSF